MCQDVQLKYSTVLSRIDDTKLSREMDPHIQYGGGKIDRFRSNGGLAWTLFGAVLGVVVIAATISSYVFSEGVLSHDHNSSAFQPFQRPRLINSQSHPKRSLPSGCQRECGSMNIPYPFGLSNECAWGRFFVLHCNYTEGIDRAGVSKLNFWPFLTNVAVGQVSGFQSANLNSSQDDIVRYESTISTFQVLSISENRLLIETSKIKAMSCESDTWGNASITLPSDGQYRLSDHNILAGVGCKSRALYSPKSNEAAWNSHVGNCGPNSCTKQVLYPFCGSYDCCTLSIPPSQNIFIVGQGRRVRGYIKCGYGSLLLPSSFRGDNPDSFGEWTYGTELIWALPASTEENDPNACQIDSFKSSVDYACERSANAMCNFVDVTNGTVSNLTGYYCSCKDGFQGNGYSNGVQCTDINECDIATLNKCDTGAICKNQEGTHTCECQGGAQGDGLKDGTGCRGGRNTVLVAGFAAVSGALIISCIGGLCLCCYHKRQMKVGMKVQAMDPTLSRMEALHEMQQKGGVKICKIFTLEELIKATGNFGRQNVVGEGGCGEVYRGTLDAGTEVAIKKANNVTGGRNDARQFINEVTILSTVNHHNLVKLLGCCLETAVPILVYDYISNGSLLDYFKRSDSSSKRENEALLTKALDWDQRLKIAVGTASALSYLHSGTSPPIYHRDVKSANILLDKKYVAKVADFGLSKLVPLDNEATHLSTAVQGTAGYLDPQYFESYQITEKSDVYSFGVVLLELLTAEKVLDSSRPGQDQNLVQRCRRLLKFGLFDEIIDPNLEAASNPDVMDAVYIVAQVAMDCCERTSDNRPTMRQVEDKLRSLRRSTNPYSSTSDLSRSTTGYKVDFQARDSSDSTPMTSQDFSYSEYLENSNAWDSTPSEGHPILNKKQGTLACIPITSREFTDSENPVHNNKFASSSNLI